MKKETLSFQSFKTIVSASISLYPKTWWRVLCLNLITLLLIALMTAILGVIAFVINENTGNSFENYFNPETGIKEEFAGLIFSFIGIFIVTTILFSILGKSAIVLMIKRFESKKKLKRTTLWNIYFKEAPKFFKRFFINGLRIFWYIIWPLLAIGGISGILFFGSTFIPTSAPQIGGMNIISAVIGIIGIIISIFLLIKRSILTAFTQNILFIKDISSKESFSKSIELAKGKIWKLIGFYSGIGLIGALIGFIIGFTSAFFPLQEGIEVADIIIQIIIPPFAITVYYLLTNTLLNETKKISKKS